MAKMVYDPTIGRGEALDEPTKGTAIIDDPKPVTQTQSASSGYTPLHTGLELPMANPTLEQRLGATTTSAGNSDTPAASYHSNAASNNTQPSGSPTTPQNNGGNASSGGGGGYPSGGGGGYPSGGGGGYPSGGGGSPAGGSGAGATPSLTEEQLAEINAIEGKNIEPTDYLLNEYNNMDAYKQEQQDLINNSTQQLIDLANQQIDEQLKVTLSDYANQLDQAQQQFSIARAKLEQMKATEADNLALAAQAKGDYGGVAKAQYSAQMQQRDQALYEIDLAQINLEQQINQAITEAKATGNYTKLAHQIELATAQYENLLALAADVENIKTSDATRLDQYYLQVQQLQQESILNKINYGIAVTAEDMAQFGLSGAEAKSAADAINASQGVERQMLAEQLKSMQRANTAATYSGGGGGGYYGDGGSGSGGEETPVAANSAMLNELQQRSSNGSLQIYSNNGNGTGRVLRLTIGADGSVSYDPGQFKRGEYIVLNDGTKLYADGNGQLVDSVYYDNQYQDATGNWMRGASGYASGSTPKEMYTNLKTASTKFQSTIDTLIATAQNNFSAQNGGAWINKNQIKSQLSAYLSPAQMEQYNNAVANKNSVDNYISQYEQNGGWA